MAPAVTSLNLYFVRSVVARGGISEWNLMGLAGQRWGFCFDVRYSPRHLRGKIRSARCHTAPYLRHALTEISSWPQSLRLLGAVGGAGVM